MMNDSSIIRGSWCVRVTNDNIDVVELWRRKHGLHDPPVLGSHHGIDRNGYVLGLNPSQDYSLYFDIRISTEEFYRSIDHRGWCVQVTKENRDVIRTWMSNPNKTYTFGSYYGISRNGDKQGNKIMNTYFDMEISTEQFYAMIGHDKPFREWSIKLTTSNRDDVRKFFQDKYPIDALGYGFKLGYYYGEVKDDNKHSGRTMTYWNPDALLNNILPEDYFAGNSSSVLDTDSDVVVSLTTATIKDAVSGYRVENLSGDESRAIQELLFNIGFEWFSGRTEYQNVTAFRTHKYDDGRYIMSTGNPRSQVTLTGKQYIKLIKNKLKLLNYGKEANREVQGPREPGSCGQAVGVKGKPFKVASAGRLDGNPVKSSRVRGRIRGGVLNGKLFSI